MTAPIRASDTPETRNQLQCLQQGGPFEVNAAPMPPIAPDRVLIRQKVIALNDLDRKQRDLGLMIAHWPHVLGIEGAGIIEAIGSDVTEFQLGDEVLAWEAGMAHGEDWGGAYQSHVVMPARYVAKKPKNMSLEEAASLPICYITAVCALHADLQMPLSFLPSISTSGLTPKSILILGGSSATGAAAIQLVRLAYPELPIFATSSPKHHVHVASLGATQVFDYHSSTVVSEIQAASPGANGVDMILDCVGAGASQTDICNVLNPAGSKKYAAVMTGAQIAVPEGVTKFDSHGAMLVDLPGGDQVTQALTKLVEGGQYKLPLPVRAVGHGLAQVLDIMDQTQTVSGEKLVVTL